MKFIVSAHVSNINYFNETTSGTLAVAGACGSRVEKKIKTITKNFFIFN
jgi:hypothetical protein